MYEMKDPVVAVRLAFLVMEEGLKVQVGDGGVLAWEACLSDLEELL